MSMALSLITESNKQGLTVDRSDRSQDNMDDKGRWAPLLSGLFPGPVIAGWEGYKQKSEKTWDRSRQDTKRKTFVCTVCNLSFGHKHVLKNHERTHTGERPFECAECHKRFGRDHHLKAHIRLHTGEKPYHCPHCERDFVQVANLRRHLRVHTGERPFPCTLCGATFADSNQLKAHVLVHRGEKPFECNDCGLKFRRRHHLGHHKCGATVSPPPLATAFSVLPEQTEPEDLSISSKKKHNNNNNNDDSPPQSRTDSWPPTP